MIPLVSVIVPAVFAAGLIGISHIPILAGAAMKVMWGIDWLLKVDSQASFLCFDLRKASMAADIPVLHLYVHRPMVFKSKTNRM